MPAIRLDDDFEETGIVWMADGLTLPQFIELGRDKGTAVAIQCCVDVGLFDRSLDAGAEEFAKP